MKRSGEIEAPVALDLSLTAATSPKGRGFGNCTGETIDYDGNVTFFLAF